MKTKFFENGPGGNVPEEQKAKSTPHEWLSGEQVCRMLMISKRTLQNYRDKNVIPFSQIGRKIYYKYSDIVEYLELNHVKAEFQKGGLS